MQPHHDTLGLYASLIVLPARAAPVAGVPATLDLPGMHNPLNPYGESRD